MNDTVPFRVRLIPHPRYSFLKIIEEFEKNWKHSLRPEIDELHVPHQECTIMIPNALLEKENVIHHFKVLLSLLDPNLLTEVMIVDMNLKAKEKKESFVDRALSASVIPLSYHDSTVHCLEACYHIFHAGIDMVFDHPLLTSLPNNVFEERIRLLTEEEKKQTQLSKRKKWYIPNVTARSLFETERRCSVVKESDLSFIAVDALLVGLFGMATLSSMAKDYDLQILCFPLESGFTLSFPKPASLTPKLTTLLLAQFETIITSPVIRACSTVSQIEEEIKQWGTKVILDGTALIEKNPEGIAQGARIFSEAFSTIAPQL